jgi:hypothetical protein
LDFAEGALGTDILKVHEGLIMAESLLAVKLRTGTDGFHPFLL